MAADSHNVLPENRSKKKAAGVCFAIVLAGFPVMILLCVFAFRIAERSAFKANPNNANDTVQAFAYSLAHNKLDRVKSHVSEDKWIFIDSWSAHHEAISSVCKAPSDPEFGPFWISTFDDSTQTMSIYFDFTKECPDYFYIFHIDADHKRVDNTWQGIDCSEICEQTPEERYY